MSAQEGLQEAVIAAIGLAPAFAKLSVFDAPPVRGALPHAVVDPPVLGDWSTKDWTGREGRIVVTMHDAGERPVRLRALIGAMEDAVEATGPALGGGWRVAAIRLARSRIARSGSDRWMAMSEFVVRLYRES